MMANERNENGFVIGGADLMRCAEYYCGNTPHTTESQQTVLAGFRLRIIFFEFVVEF